MNIINLDLETGLGSDLGIKIDSAQLDRVIGHMDVTQQHLNHGGKVHGGVMMALADVVAAHATLLNLPDGMTTTTIESKTNFIRSAGLGQIFAESVPIHVGRTTMVWQTSVRDESGTIYAVVMQTQLVFKNEKTDGPAATPTKTNQPAEARTSVSSEEHLAPVSFTADRRKEQILTAAFRVISEKGFANATMREIAREAGMPVPTMYQYVRSKDELLEAIFDGYLGKVKESVQLSSGRSTSATEKLRVAIEANITEFDRFKSQIRMMNSETRSVTTSVRERIKQHMLNYIQLFRNIIEEGVAAGEFRPVNIDLYANFIPMLCEIWPLRPWAVGGYGVSGVRDGIVDMALYALAIGRHEG